MAPDAHPWGWPTVTTHAADRLRRVALPVGGIGTGTISLGGRGNLLDWELFNRPAKGFTPESFLCVRVAGDGVRDGQQTRVLEGVLPDTEYDGPLGSPTPLHGLPRFRRATFAAAYPFGTVTLADPDVPLDITLGAFNPLVPGDADASGLPVAILRIRLRNKGAQDLDVSLAASVHNVLGRQPGAELPDGNGYELVGGNGCTTLVGRTTVDPTAESWGTLALSLLDAEATSARTSWAKRSWGDSLLDFWQDFSHDGLLDEPDLPARVPTGSLTTGRRLAPGEHLDVTLVIAWHVPNRRGWRHDLAPPPDHSHSEDVVGNHYATRFVDAADVVDHVAAHLPALEKRTLALTGAVAASDLPTAVQDAALSNLAVLRSTTCFRIEDGTFLGWEGSMADHGSCHGSCTHVWNYQYALEQLHPDLAWSMREVELVHSLDERGLMSFRAGLPLATTGTGWRVAAADGQMGALVRLHRTWRLSGDTERLRALWPHARRALEFAWVEKGWDADRDGVMEGCQHNTMDVEYYGPNGVGQSWYLAALAACVDLATAVGDDDFATTCTDLLERGARATDALLFNGDYYEQDVRPPGTADAIAEGLRIRYAGDSPFVGSDDLVEPVLQIGPGCGTDQLAGHAMAVLSGLDDRLDPAHVATAVRSVNRENHRDDLTAHVNHMRSYALGDEAGLLNCTYPRGNRPARPFPYSEEVWTGFEHTAAVCLALEGEHDLAAEVVGDVRDRHDGMRRNPFNEVECGNHYVRSMASFALLHAWPRAVVDRVADTLTVAPVPGRWVVVAGDRVGHVVVTVGPEGATAAYEPVLGDAFATVRVNTD
ncbi:GH116 family glycosyl-hydrolase [Terrabacter sp. GCM10028922]|uniref:GH116 family glycosyl-hydrolase n=1 Tax=Terrabacter sp. GCM10028922 TaxID=3273428 RepID=UPI003615EACC